MSNYAKVINGIVEKIIVAEASFFDTFIDNTPGIWVEYTNASIGDTYDATGDAFIPPKTYPSWILNETTSLWEPPTAYPDDGKIYEWNEDTTAWVEVT